jgi:hypothetical protein
MARPEDFSRTPGALRTNHQSNTRNNPHNTQRRADLEQPNKPLACHVLPPARPNNLGDGGLPRRGFARSRDVARMPATRTSFTMPPDPSDGSRPCGPGSGTRTCTGPPLERSDQTGCRSLRCLCDERWCPILMCSPSQRSQQDLTADGRCRVAPLRAFRISSPRTGTPERGRRIEMSRAPSGRPTMQSTLLRPGLGCERRLLGVHPLQLSGSRPASLSGCQ